MSIDWDLAPTAAEAARDEAETQCALKGHVLGEDEDGEIICDRCGASSLDVEEPSDPAEEPTPSEDLLLDWAQRDLDRIRLSPTGWDDHRARSDHRDGGLR